MNLAIEAIEQADVPHKLVVTGKSGWGEERQSSKLSPTGYVTNPQLSSLYSQADLYLAPSRHEGFGIPVLEAFRCGCPVLASSGGALPETVGNGGLVERSWEPEQWARTIEKLLKDRSTLDDLRRRGYEREKEFSWRETARRTLEVYREVAR
jgi:glycosyltransferase involved in cell wall biosynthesis